jgi:hypothetical protein
MHRLTYPVFITLIVLALTGCNFDRSTAPVDTRQETPIVVSEPTPVIAEPSPVVISEAAPTALPNEVPMPDPIAAPSAGIPPLPLDPDASSGPRVEIADITPFLHPSGIFAVDAPANWIVQDNSRADSLVFAWFDDPAQTLGAMLVQVYEQSDGTTLSPDELGKQLQAFLVGSFASQPGTTIYPPDTTSGDTVTIGWRLETNKDGQDVRLLGTGQIAQLGNKIALQLITLPEHQVEEYSAELTQIATSFRVNEAIALTDADAPPINPVVDATDVVDDASDPSAPPSAVGAMASLGTLDLLINAFSRSPGDSYNQPESGNEFVLVNVTITNRGSETAFVSSIIQMALRDSTGVSYDVDIAASLIGSGLPEGEVAPGATLSGDVGFQVPLGANGLIFIFSDSMSGEAVEIALQ